MLNDYPSLEEMLDKNLPVATIEDVFKAEGLTDEDRFTISEYLSAFAMMTDDKCICCGRLQSGLTAAIMGGGFTWGIAHGEGFCSTCHWPARAYHFNVGPITRFSAVLQYHPSVATKKVAA